MAAATTRVSPAVRCGRPHFTHQYPRRPGATRRSGYPWPADSGASPNSRTGDPPDEHEISWAIDETSNLCRVLGLLAVGADWSDRSYGLTDTGKATALEALRARATGPRTMPWP
jgi:hypothetical protein